MRWLHTSQALEDLLHPSRVLALPFGQHLLDSHSFQLFLGAAQVAGNDRVGPGAGESRYVSFGAVRQRPNHHVLTIFAAQFRRHASETRAVKHVQEERFDDVVPVVPKCDLGTAVLFGEGVEDASPEP